MKFFTAKRPTKLTILFRWLSNNGLQIAFIAAAVIHISLVFPPKNIQPDTMHMLQDSISLRYTDWVSPLTILLWHGLNYLKEGFDLMLALNLAFLWGAILIGLHSFKEKKIAYWFLVIPFVPSILIDSGNILKDTIFSYGYMFIAMFLVNKTIHKEDLKVWQVILLVGGILYFSMLKVQAKFIFPFMIWWIIWLTPKSNSQQSANYILKGIMVVLISVSVLVGMQKCNQFFITRQTNTNYWQYVKIYDLAGMSVFANKMYVPSFLFKHKKVTIQDINKTYDYLWEPLIVYEYSPLKRLQNEHELELLLIAWKQAIRENPWAYLQHRGRLWFKILSASAFKGKFVEWVGEQSPLLKIAPMFSLFSFLPLLPIFLYFWWLGVRRMREYEYALPLFMLSSMGLMLIGVLFICSLAAAGRYIYFSWCCFMFAVPFAYQVCCKHPKYTWLVRVKGFLGIKQ